MQGKSIIILLLFIGVLSCRSARTPQQKLRAIMDDYPYLSEVPVQIDSVPVKISYPSEKFLIPLTAKDTVVQGNNIKFDLHNKEDTVEINVHVKDTAIYKKTETKLVPVPENPKKDYKIFIYLIVTIFGLLFVFSKR